MTILMCEFARYDLTFLLFLNLIIVMLWFVALMEYRKMRNEIRKLIGKGKIK